MCIRDSPRSSSERPCRTPPYHFSLRGGHRTLECPVKIGNGAFPVPLSEENLIGPVSDFIVREYFKECYCLFLMRWPAVGGFLLSWPEDVDILCVAFLEYRPVLRVPGIIQRLHETHVFFCS